MNNQELIDTFETLWVAYLQAVDSKDDHRVDLWVACERLLTEIRNRAIGLSSNGQVPS